MRKYKVHEEDEQSILE